MRKNNLIAKTIAGALALAGTSAAFAHETATKQEPLTYLVKFDITGNPNPSGDGSFIINGPGYATLPATTGAIPDKIVPGLKVAKLSGAEIVFSGSMTDPVVDFTCRSNSCRIEIGGSVLTSDAGVPLAGKMVPMWGPVNNSNFKPPSTTPLRILGCGGMKDISGKGVFANMVGSICFNGVFNVPDFSTNFTLTGGSNCTITMHTPMVPIP